MIKGTLWSWLILVMVANRNDIAYCIITMRAVVSQTLETLGYIQAAVLLWQMIFLHESWG